MKSALKKSSIVCVIALLSFFSVSAQYPNPNSGNFNISLDSGLFNEKEELKVVVYRENGTILFEKNVVNIENNIPIKLDNFQEGNYSVVIFSADKRISKKVIIKN